MDDTWTLRLVLRLSLISPSISSSRKSFSQCSLLAVDVNIYGSAGSEPLHGNHENTEIGEFIKDYLKLDLKSVTKKLQEKGTQFDMLSANSDVVSSMAKSPKQGGRELDQLDLYHSNLRTHH
jgi:hypothetical protein